MEEIENKLWKKRNDRNERLRESTYWVLAGVGAHCALRIYRAFRSSDIPGP